MKLQTATSNLALFAARDAETEISKGQFVQNGDFYVANIALWGVWQGEIDIIPKHDLGYLTGLGVGGKCSGAKP
jgi:hypothetical protein